jgi:Co/Zn/Cd efflux system component
VLAIAALLGGKYAGWNWLDPVMGIVGAVMIANWTRALLAETGTILLDSGNHDELEREIRAAIETDEDTRISDLHLWQVGQEKYACILAIVAQSPRSAAVYKDRLNEVHELAHVTVEVTPGDPAPAGAHPRANG